MNVRIEYSRVESTGRRLLVSNFETANLVDYLSACRLNFLFFIVNLDASFGLRFTPKRAHVNLRRGVAFPSSLLPRLKVYPHSHRSYSHDPYPRQLPSLLV